MYTLNNSFIKSDGRTINYDFPVIIVGCGGTGGFAAEGLARVLPKRADIILVDHDIIEEQNLTRQNYFSAEAGMLKSEALAKRLAQRYDRAIGYSVQAVSGANLSVRGIIVECVDNGLARQDIAERLGNPGSWWWVDAGNGDNFGQVLIGNASEAYFWEPKNICVALPLPTIQRPELLSQIAPPQEPCEEFPEQGPTINQVMAVLVVEVVRRLVEGSCSWMQLLLDMRQGTLVPVTADPDTAVKMFGKSKVRINHNEKLD